MLNAQPVQPDDIDVFKNVSRDSWPCQKMLIFFALLCSPSPTCIVYFSISISLSSLFQLLLDLILMLSQGQVKVFIATCILCQMYGIKDHLLCAKCCTDGGWMSLRRVKGLRIKPLPQPRSPKFPNSVPPARGHTCTWRTGVGGVWNLWWTRTIFYFTVVVICLV